MIDTGTEFSRGSFLDERVHRVLAVPRRQRPSEWAAEHRVLQTKDSSEPGPWSNLRAPYLTAIMDACGDPEVSDVVVPKAAQVGLSEVMRNVLAYWIANDPGPALWVMPDETSAKGVMAEKLLPMIQATPALAGHLTDRKHDAGATKILLDHMEIHCAWATSPQSLASRPKRYVINDEVDKFPTWSGDESDPVALGNKRRTTFGHRSKGALLSTPTTRAGAIWKAWEACPVRLRYHIPCPHCGEFGAPSWSQVRWPADLPGTRAEQASAIEVGALAWYHCARCGARIEERQRESMVARGVWAADGCETVAKDGTLVGERPKSRRIGFHVPALISPWVSWSQMAAEFVAAIGDEAKMMDWRNSRLGEPFEVRAATVKSGAFDEKIAAGHHPGLVPAWAGVVLSSADTQKDGYWFVNRAWGHGFRSRLISHGHVATLAELRAQTIDARFPWDGVALEPIAPQLLIIDSGGGTDTASSDLNTTHQVYQFALGDPARIYAAKGYGNRVELDVPIRQTFISYAAPGDPTPSKLALYHLRVGYFKDVLAARIGKPPTDPESWELHAKVDADYCRQLTSEHKVIMRKGRGQVARWVPVTAGAANHLWDCEVYQTAAAQIAHVELLPTAEQLAEQRRLIARPRPAGGDGWDSAVRDW